MSKTIDICELAAQLNEIVELVAAGHEVILLDGETPCARIVPCDHNRRMPGLNAGGVTTTPDFDAPLPDDYWQGNPVP